MKSKTLWLLAMLISSTWASGQSIGPRVINASGGTASISGNTYEWSIGELAVATVSTASLIVTQGVLQPQMGTNAISQVKNGNHLFQVFPNPVNDYLFVQPNMKPNSDISLQLTDVTGKVINQQSASLLTGSEKQSISLRGLAAGNYFLWILINESSEIYKASYKITKQ